MFLQIVYITDIQLIRSSHPKAAFRRPESGNVLPQRKQCFRAKEAMFSLEKSNAFPGLIRRP